MQSQTTQRWDTPSLTVMALSALVALLFCLGCLFSYEKLRDERQGEDRAEAQRMLLAFEAHSVRLFDYADAQLRAMRAYLSEHDNNTENLTSFIDQIKAPRAEFFTGTVIIFDRDGWTVYHSDIPRDQFKAIGKVTDLDHYQYFTAHPGDSLFVGATRLGRSTGKMQYRLARPIFKNGVFDGMVMLTLLPEYITDFYRSTSLGPHGTVTMITQGKLIARQPSIAPEKYNRLMSNLNGTYSGMAAAPVEGHRNLGSVSPFDQIRRDIFYKNLVGYPVALVIGIAEQDRIDILAGARRNLSLLAAAFTLFSMLTCSLILRLLSKNRHLVTAETVSCQSLAQLRRLSDSIQTTKEHERKRIAQDIHDELGQNLLVLKMDATALWTSVEGTHPKLDQRAALVLNNINATIQSVKSIMNDLRPATLELGLLAGVEWQLTQFMRTSGIDCKLVATEEDNLELGEERVSAIFRIFQESLTNVARHAQATKVEVTLLRDERGFSMTIKDNGKGLEPGDSKKLNSFGLLGIKERAHALRAEFTMESSPENGTALTIFIAMEEVSTNMH
jgi:signal transduction histidine kinase